MDDTIREEGREIDTDAVLADSDLLADDILGDIGVDMADDSDELAAYDEDE